MSGLDLSDIPAADLAPVLDEMARLLRVVPLSPAPDSTDASPPSRTPAASGAGDSSTSQGASA